MALPTSHRHFLERQLQVHEQRIETLRAQQVELDAEIRIHRLVVSLGRDERVLRVLDDLTELPATSHAADIESRVRTAAIEIQSLQEFEVVIETDASSAPVSVRAVHMDTRYPFMISWSRREGFRATQLEPARGTGSA